MTGPIVICDFADVVVVPFPFVDRPQVKRRPALVLSARVFNQENGHTILAMITTAARSAWPGDIAILDFPATGLSHPSTIRFKLFTLPNDLMLKRAGALTATDRQQVLQSLETIMPGQP